MAAVAAAPALRAAPSASKRRRVEKASGAAAPPSASVAVNRLFKAIENPGSLDALQRAAKLYALAASPKSGFYRHVLGLDAEHKVPTEFLTSCGADAAARAAHVDTLLAGLLMKARENPKLAAARLAVVPKESRVLLALRFLALAGFDVALAAENVQGGLETVLDKEAYDDVADDRDSSVDDFGMAMDVLRDTLPAQGVFQAALDALLAGECVPAECADAFESMTDDCICPDLDWLFDVEEAEDEEDEEDEE